jgi:predicted transcriptional regulator
MKKRGRPPEGKTSTIRVSEDIARKLRLIAVVRKTRVPRLADPLLKPFTDREYPKALREAEENGDATP